MSFSEASYPHCCVPRIGCKAYVQCLGESYPIHERECNTLLKGCLGEQFYEQKALPSINRTTKQTNNQINNMEHMKNVQTNGSGLKGVFFSCFIVPFLLSSIWVCSECILYFLDILSFFVTTYLFKFSFYLRKVLLKVMMCSTLMEEECNLFNSTFSLVFLRWIIFLHQEPFCIQPILNM